MGQYTLKVDSKDPLYKKLIKLPIEYYRLKQDNNSYTIDSHIGTAEFGNISDIKLQKKGDEIALCKEDSVLKLQNGEDFIIKKEDIIGENKNDIIQKLISGEEVLISAEYIAGSPNFGIGLSFYNPDEDSLTGVLKFINFYDKSDPTLQKIKKEKGGLYFTVEDDNTDHSKTIHISDKDGNHLPEYDDYRYEYKQGPYDVLTIDEIIESLINTNNVQQKFTLQKGKELSEDTYEANICLNDKLVATLPNIGYYMLNNQLVMRNHVTKEQVVIPEDFHYLKVVRCNNNDDYKLALCNFLGNEFFEYKKYDPQYSDVPDEYRHVSLNYIKEEHNPKFCRLLKHQPSFFITKGITYSDSPDHYSADIFELTNNGKGRKIATLIDEFGYFNKVGKFKYRDYHKEMEYRVYDNSQIDQEYKVTGVNSEFFLIEDKDLTLHTIPELF
ncbi:MAG: hypothetical protein ACEY3K_10960 [Wolbachia sp.]